MRLFPASQINTQSGSSEWQKEFRLRRDGTSAHFLMLDEFEPPDEYGRCVPFYMEHVSLRSLNGNAARAVPCLGEGCFLCAKGIAKKKRVLFSVALVSLYDTNTRQELEKDCKTARIAPWSSVPWEERIFIVNVSDYPTINDFESKKKETQRDLDNYSWILQRRTGAGGITNYNWIDSQPLDENVQRFRHQLKPLRHDLEVYLDARTKDNLEDLGLAPFVGMHPSQIPNLVLTYQDKKQQQQQQQQQQQGPVPYQIYQNPSPQQMVPLGQQSQMQPQMPTSGWVEAPVSASAMQPQQAPPQQFQPQMQPLAQQPGMFPGTPPQQPLVTPPAPNLPQPQSIPQPQQQQLEIQAQPMPAPQQHAQPGQFAGISVPDLIGADGEDGDFSG